MSNTTKELIILFGMFFLFIGGIVLGEWFAKKQHASFYDANSMPLIRKIEHLKKGVPYRFSNSVITLEEFQEDGQSAKIFIFDDWTATEKLKEKFKTEKFIIEQNNEIHVYRTLQDALK